LEFVLSSLAATSDKQYESIPDDKIALLVRKFRALHMFDERRSLRGCFECGNTTHFSTDFPKPNKLDSSSNKYRFGDKKKKF
jgi:hypothetical protein